MKKNISKEQIVHTVLEILKNSDDIDRINFREIARLLGCSHTNLYNYFPTYNDLIWECHSTVLNNFSSSIKQIMSSDHDMTMFFDAIINMYINNKGWFRLSWYEPIKGERPKNDIEAAKLANHTLNDYAMSICKRLFKKCPSKQNVKRILHNTHCYIIGEISNYILGRGFIDNEEEFKTYIINEASSMFQICIMNANDMEV